MRTPSSWQSPVNLRSPVVVPGSSGSLDLRWEKGSQRFDVVSEAHGHRFRPVVAQEAVLGGEAYRLANVHFHRPGEHWVDGEPQQAELHAVHVRAERALQVLVVSVLLRYEADGDGGAPTSFDLGALLPARRSFYRYEGSLSTPDHDENVSHAVFAEPVQVADQHLARFIAGRADRARPPQDLGRRYLLLCE
ncbi:carbonic anhydrase family protein [Actinosynnema pretiosum subsp. pretiosum]|uniref:carbonic anhydrase n=1 Tax=Actinosynnema pretiosum subsp. pretiosum TaxID=103721 RepID=A0AA45R5R6_9PSEU|nr:Carbonic anhydrase [Actinosynnema pretiosum subsp. pretiosum]QUF06227.1 carbonic anhydrase family protein [Actinosynnema pretiosum subsp. pretiosum]